MLLIEITHFLLLVPVGTDTCMADVYTSPAPRRRRMILKAAPLTCIAVDAGEHFVVRTRWDDAVGGGQGETLRGAVEELQLSRLVLLLRLLPPQRHLRRHHALPLGDQCALGAHTVLPAAVALVALQRGHHAVVPAAGTLRGARVLVRGAQDERRAAQKAPGQGHRDGA